MVDKYGKFYKSRSKKYKRYEFKSESILVKGKKPNFFSLVKKYSNLNFTALDLGCGSGELTFRLSPLFSHITGIDLFEDYIKTAKKDARNNNVRNVEFLVADAAQLPFEKKVFDVVYSSRGPLSASLDFMSESCRVLKDRGLLIEETIGEEDKLELEIIFNRGHSYPHIDSKLNSVKKLINKLGVKLVFSKYYKYYQSYDSLDKIIDLLERAPIIPDFDKDKDIKSIKAIEKKLKTTKGIVLSSHRLHWVAKKTL